MIFFRTTLFFIIITISSVISQLPNDVYVKTFYDVNKVSFKGDRTIWMGEVPTLFKHFWVLDQSGKIFKLYPNAQGEYDGNSKATIADFSNRTKMVLSSEYGAYGIGFHPKFPETPKFYIIYLAHTDPNNPNNNNKSGGKIKVDEWSVAGAKYDQLTRVREILNYDHKAAYGTSNMTFGPDGYLYVALNDYEQDSRILTHWGRKILRIDIDKKDPGKEYAIPTDNPFYTNSNPEVKKEIWAYGFRNAWSLHFDPFNGDLWVADVGQVVTEEMNIVTKGANYGWGDGGDGAAAGQYGYGFNGSCANSNETNCSLFSDPAWSFGRGGGDNPRMACIAAGVTYRGDESSSLYGYHIFGDVNTNNLVAMKKGGTPVTIGNVGPLVTQSTDHNGIVHYSEDIYGNIYTVFVSWNAAITHELYMMDHADLIPSTTPIGYGCTNPAATNYDSTAVRDDSSCILPVHDIGSNFGKIISITGNSHILYSVPDLGLYSIDLISPNGSIIKSQSGFGPEENGVLTLNQKGMFILRIASSSGTTLKKIFQR